MKQLLTFAIVGVLTANPGQAQEQMRQSPRRDSQDAFIALVIRELKPTDDQVPPEPQGGLKQGTVTYFASQYR